MKRSPLDTQLSLLAFAAAAQVLWGCAQPEVSDDELERLRREVGVLGALPPSPTNAVADSPAAAKWGQALFFDSRMSADGKVACATCHDPQEGWSDPRKVSLGVEGREGRRHSQSLWNVGYGSFFFWDGRADSLWSQALDAIEGDVEMDISRVEVAHFVARHHRADYEAAFGPLPDTSVLPERGGPGEQAWEELPSEVQDQVNLVFSNVGKALEAYQRRIVCRDTRFDRFLAGEDVLTSEERQGAHVFVAAGCLGCHNGPNLTDNAFHNLAVGHEGEVDPGRKTGIRLLLTNPFNAGGKYSDDPEAGAFRLTGVDMEPEGLGAFKTPGLRGVAQRRSFGHTGKFPTLGSMLQFYDNGDQGPFAGQVDPLMAEVNLAAGEDPLEAFLRTLDCPPPPAELIQSAP